MTQKQNYFIVKYEAGAYIDGYFHQKDEIVALDPSIKAPEWGIPCDAEGNPLPQAAPRQSVDDRLASALGNKIANGTPNSNQAENKAGDQNSGSAASSERIEQIKQAVSMLEHDKDEQWNADGRVSMDALNSLLGFTATRKEVEEAAPDLKRQVK